MTPEERDEYVRLRQERRVLTDRMYELTGVAEYICGACAAPLSTACPMLRDEVWVEIAPLPCKVSSCGGNVVPTDGGVHNGGLLCFPCAEKRLGRCIILEDLEECGGNAVAIALLRRERAIRYHLLHGEDATIEGCPCCFR